MNELRCCDQCQEPLKGRADQKFCSNYCRSVYHNLLNRERQKRFRTIHKEMLLNRTILEGIWKTKIERLSMNQLIKKGFRLDRLTGAINSESRYCYDFELRLLNHKEVVLIYRPDLLNYSVGAH